MKHEKSIISETLDNYFKKLDDAQITQNGMFPSENEKEKYETFLMYAFRKYRAAIYHYENVKRFIETDEAEATDFKLANIQPKEDKKYPTLKSVMKISWTADHYVYELSAFLEALKSSVDFLATVCCFHLSDIKCDSIRRLINHVKEGRTGPIFDKVEKYHEWLEKLRKYRNYVVHRLILSTSSGHETRVIKNVSKTVRYPILIPESPPSYVPDTRMKRAMEEELMGLASSESELRFKSLDGREEIVIYSFSYYPSTGFVYIEDFLESHLNKFEGFFMEIIYTLSSLDFKICNK